MELTLRRRRLKAEKCFSNGSVHPKGACPHLKMCGRACHKPGALTFSATRVITMATNERPTVTDTDLILPPSHINCTDIMDQRALLDSEESCFLLSSTSAPHAKTDVSRVWPADQDAGHKKLVDWQGRTRVKY